jgi:hypothetical protein
MIRCLSVLFLLLLTNIAPAGDWPQWLGPTRDAATPETVAPWKDAPKILWRLPVGEGHSSPIVAGGKVFIQYRREQKDANPKTFEEVLIALDAKNGEKIWEASCGDTTKFSNIFGNGPRATPSLVDGRVYTLGVTGILNCFDVDKGKIIWQVDTLKEFKAANLLFGISGSPLIDGDHVLVNVGAKNAAIVAFDRKTGKIIWKKLDDGASYSSAIAFGKGKDRQAVFLTQKGLVSLHPQDGDVFWQEPFVDKLNESSTTPVHFGDLLVVSTIMSGRIASRFLAVSASVSPLSTLEKVTAMFSVSALSRFSAISKEVRVRVLASKKRLTTVLPRSAGTFLTCREEISFIPTAVSRMSEISSADSSAIPTRSFVRSRLVGTGESSPCGAGVVVGVVSGLMPRPPRASCR